MVSLSVLILDLPHIMAMADRLLSAVIFQHFISTNAITPNGASKVVLKVRLLQDAFRLITGIVRRKITIISDFLRFGKGGLFATVQSALACIFVKFLISLISIRNL